MSDFFQSGSMSGVKDGAPPLPGTGLVTPQAGTKPTDFSFGPASRDDVQKFFDPQRYHGRTCGLDEPTKWRPQQMITSRENIIRFFHPRTYTGDRCPEKRAAPPETPSSVASSAPRAKAKMSKDELLVKFKLAAELNGIEWSDFAVPLLHLYWWGVQSKNP